jgi:hypothetical protein
VVDRRFVNAMLECRCGEGDRLVHRVSISGKAVFNNVLGSDTLMARCRFRRIRQPQSTNSSCPAGIQSEFRAISISFTVELGTFHRKLPSSLIRLFHSYRTPYGVCGFPFKPEVFSSRPDAPHLVSPIGGTLGIFGTWHLLGAPPLKRFYRYCLTARNGKVC